MRILLLASLILVLAIAPAAAEEFFGGTLQVVAEGPAEIPGPLGTAVLAPEYSNVSTFTGQGYAHGGATLQSGNTITRLVADDITPIGTNVGQSVTQFKFSMVNFNASAVSVRPRVRFWSADGTSGAPGTYYSVPVAVGFSFNPLTINANTVSVVTATIATGQFTMPGTTFWAGLTFDNNNGATGATATQLNNFGQGIFNPPALGSSADLFFVTSAAGSFFPTNNPAGSLTNFGGNPVGNFGWEFSVDAPVAVESSTWGRIKQQF